MSLEKVRAALMQGYQAANLGLATAYENVAFTPTPLTLWAEVAYVPGLPVMATIGQGGMDTVDGYLQISLNQPIGKGSGDAIALADTLRAYFYRGRVLSYDGQDVRIKNVGTKPGYADDDCFKTPVMIDFYAQIPSNS